MFNIDIILMYGNQFFWALLTTIQIALSACAIGIIVGSVTGLILIMNKGILYHIVSLYTSVIRGTPMLVQLFIVYYVFPYVGISLTAISAAILASGINSGAYVAHIVRGGIQAVPRGQWEAAQTLGFSTMQTLWYVIIPQSIPLILPMFGNELITLIKDSSLTVVLP